MHKQHKLTTGKAPGKFFSEPSRSDCQQETTISFVIRATDGRREDIGPRALRFPLPSYLAQQFQIVLIEDTVEREFRACSGKHGSVKSHVHLRLCLAHKSSNAASGNPPSQPFPAVNKAAFESDLTCAQHFGYCALRSSCSFQGEELRFPRRLPRQHNDPFCHHRKPWKAKHLPNTKFL